MSSWHRVVFWASLGVASVFAGYSTVRPDRRVITIFEDEGRESIKKYLRYNFPQLAEKIGAN